MENEIRVASDLQSGLLPACSSGISVIGDRFRKCECVEYRGSPDSPIGR